MISILCMTFCIVLLCVVFPSRSKQINIGLLISAGLLMAFVAGFRIPDSDRDYSIYKAYWQSLYIYEVEISFNIIRGVLKDVLGLPLLALFVVYAFLGVYAKIRAIKLISTTVFLSLLIYVSNYYLLHELTQIRAGVAAGLLLMSVKYIYERNFYQFLLLIGIATIFHYSAFLAIPLWFLKPDSKNLKFYFILIPLGFFIYFVGIDIITSVPIPYVQNRIQAYKLMRDAGLGDRESFNIFSISYLAKIGIFLLLYLIRNKIVLENKYANILLKIYAISLFTFPLFSEIPAFSYRLQSLFGVVDIVLVPLLLHLFKYRIFGYVLVILIAAGFFFYNLSISELIK